MSRRREPVLASVVLHSPDLVGCILTHADLTPHSLVAAGQVSKAWRAAIHTIAALLLAAAHRPRFLTKGTFCGLFALSPCEADAYPHAVKPRLQGGFMCMYTSTAIDAVLPTSGGLQGWRQRLARRAVEQASLERAFGPKWRELSEMRWKHWRSAPPW